MKRPRGRGVSLKRLLRRSLGLHVNIFELIELKSYDLRFVARRPLTPRPPWPWWLLPSRRVHARVTAGPGGEGAPPAADRRLPVSMGPADGTGGRPRVHHRLRRRTKPRDVDQRRGILGVFQPVE